MTEQNKKIAIYAVIAVVVIGAIIGIVVYIRRKAQRPPVSTEPLVIIKANYVCPGNINVTGVTMDVTSKLASLVSNNSVYIPSPNMNKLFGQTDPNWCGCPNHCTHTRLDVQYRTGVNGQVYNVSFADTDSIIINK